MFTKARTLSVIFLSAFIIAGCNKTPSTSFSALNELLKPTETTLESRTPQWYADQEFIRDKVLQVCLDYLAEKAEKLGGAYKVQFDNDVFSKYAEFPDCLNARKGEILEMSSIAKIYEHQIENAERALSTPESKAIIEELAEDVAKRLSQQQQDNQI